MRILGVDPGYGILGYGAIDVQGNSIVYVSHGHISTPKECNLPRRLLILYEEFGKVLESFSPNLVAVEKLFFAKNVTTALEVGYARGIVLMEIAKHGMRIFECSPQQVKISVSGYGRARKRQVQDMIKRLLGLPEVPRPDDAADALAIAWCAALYGRKKNGSWER